MTAPAAYHAKAVRTHSQPAASQRRVWLPVSMSEEEARLKDELLHSIVNPEAAHELRGYVEDSFRRLLTTLELVPRGVGRVLELGANPYFFTLLLKRFRRFELEMANFFGGHGDNVQRLTNERTGESHEFRYREFNIEEDESPYPDQHFDGVVYCEILEHLVRDPIAVFAEIHRVLKSGGWLLVTTPNVARRQNIARLLRRQNVYDPYSAYGPYGRHNREYTAAELRELLTNTGFSLDRLVTKDIHPCGAVSKVAALALGTESGFNLYALARKEQMFRWYYPEWLLRSGGPRLRVRDPVVRAGFNDAVQFGGGWWQLERWGDGAMRWTRGSGEVFLRARGGERVLRLLLWGGPQERTAPDLMVRIDASGLPVGSAVHAHVAVADWKSVDLQLPAPLPAGQIRLVLESPVFVPDELLGTGDSRTLGVGVRELELRPSA